jgi:hypothetical protein
MLVVIDLYFIVADHHGENLGHGSQPFPADVARPCLPQVSICDTDDSIFGSLGLPRLSFRFVPAPSRAARNCVRPKANFHQPDAVDLRAVRRLSADKT